MKNVMRIIATVVTLGLLSFVAPAANADGGSDFEFTVVSRDFAYSEADFSIENRQHLLVNGATQLAWWYPNHHIKVTMKAVKKAPHIKVKYTRCAVQSKSIAKQAKGAPIVVAKVGSKICNTGKRGQIVGGFPWTVTKGLAVLKWNKKKKLYQHVYNLTGGKLVKTCGNWMGGHVDVMYPSVVQVRYAEDIQESGTAVAEVELTGSVTFNITCPNGANFNTTVTTSAMGRGESYIEFTERTRVSVLNAKKVELTNESHANGSASAMAKAETKIQVSGSCGENPPPSYDQPSVDVTPVACVNPGQTRDVTVTVSNPNAIGDTARVTLRGVTKSAAVAAHGQTSFTFTNVPAGSYTGMALLVTADKSKSFTVTVENCPPPEDNPPTMDCTGMQHIYVGEDQSAFDFDAEDLDGDAISFSTPTKTGPINIVTTETGAQNGNTRRRTVWVTAQDIPAETSQSASVTVTATAGGKSVSCTVNTTVTNEDTGW